MPDGSGDARILALPHELQRVPGFTSRDDDAWRADWFAWRDALIPYRDLVERETRHDTRLQAEERALCAADPKYFLALWGWVYEPRARKLAVKHNPFAPFAFQCHTLDWLTRIADMPEQYDGYITKSRGLGLSWTTVAFAVWGWAFRDITTLLLSRTQADVDKPNSLNTLFGKACYLIDAIPDWLLPEGFDRDHHRTQLNLYNPATAAQIFGDSTTGEAGRGDRATIAIPDEAAFIRDLDTIWTTLGGTPDHRIGVSTESTTYGMTWVNRWENAKRLDPESVCVFDWWINPYQDEAWRTREYERREKDLDLHGYFAEIERNPWTRTNLVYPEARSISFDGPGYDPALPVLAAIDPGVVDDTAIVFAQPLDGDPRKGTINWFDSYERNEKPAEFYAHILTGIPPEPGDLCYGDDFSPRDKAVMALCRAFAWSRFRVCMDPAGKQRDSGMHSFQSRLFKESKRLRERLVASEESDQKPRGIFADSEGLMALNNHQARHHALRDVLRRSRFADTPGARRFASALSMYRLQELTARATREPGPIHDDDCSHLATAGEFWAAYAVGGYFGIKRAETTPKTAEWKPFVPAFAGAD